MKSEKIGIFIVDDTAFYRTILKRVLSEMPNVEVVGSAPNGKIALKKITEIKPDIVTLDQEMPEMDGLETLRHLKAASPETMAIMVSAYTTKGAQITLKALGLGAFDFITKAAGNNFQENLKQLQSQLEPVVKAAINKRGARNGFFGTRPARQRFSGEQTAAPVPPTRKFSPFFRPKIVAVGISTGGPNALAELIPKIPGNLSAPVVIVQHMPPVFTAALAESLDKKSALTVCEAKAGQLLEAGHVYIAPGGKQMKIVCTQGSPKPCIMVTDDPPENHCRPSVDYLFRSVAEVYQNRALGIIMTGMGRDGTAGLKVMKKAGAKVIAQDEQSCVVFGMPMEAIKNEVVDLVLPLDQIAVEITRIVK